MKDGVCVSARDGESVCECERWSEYERWRVRFSHIRVFHRVGFSHIEKCIKLAQIIKLTADMESTSRTSLYALSDLYEAHKTCF